MPLRVVGAGLPRTGTLSLKTALERLLGAPCYHMTELFGHPEHLTVWQAAGDGAVDWHGFFAEYAASVDYPAGMFWRELSEAFPDAAVLLSRRASGQEWWRSMDKTIFPNMRELRELDEIPPHIAGFAEMMRRNSVDMMRFADDPEAGAAFHDQHVAEVRAAVPAERLVVWQPGDGWAPLADMLGLPVPDEPFPHENDAASFQQNFADRSKAFFGRERG